MPRFAAVLAAALIATAVTAQSITRTGYLTDILCLERRTAFDGADMLLRPQDHSIKCNLLQACIASGFTILQAPATTTPTAYGTMWNLTGAANTRAVAWMRNYPETKTNVLVHAVGVTDGSRFDAQEFTMVSGAALLSAASIAVATVAALAL